MAEEQQGQEKTEEATPRKLEKAKEEGQLARSRELNSVAIVTFGALAAMMVAPSLAQHVIDTANYFFTQASNKDLVMTEQLGRVASESASAVLPFLLIMFAAGVFSSVGVGGFVFSTKALNPKMSRMSLLKGLGRMFSEKAMVEFAKSVAKVALIGLVSTLVLNTLMSKLLVLGALPFEVAASTGMSYVGWALLLIGLVLVFVAAIDVPFQIAQHKKQLKMTKQEVKDEMKDSEGKPEVKAQIRNLQQQAAQRKMMDDVPTADVIITNPEHFSVAIRYDSNVMNAPILVAKGADFVAFRIREVGQQNEIPIVPMPMLARAVFYNTDIGAQIPDELFVAMAQVLAYVYQIDQYRRGQLDKEPILGHVAVPEAMADGNIRL